tara:strand:+ start:230 stop:793 length:564 start_codon:yes stop_codon:yes gene_type:complete
MTRNKRGSGAKGRRISGLERAKDQNPFGRVDRSFKLPSNYKETEADAFEQSGAKVSDYYKPDKGATTKFEKGDGKGFLDSVISGGLDYFDKVQGEKSDADKLIDFAKSQQKAAQFGDFGAGGFKEVADGLSYGQLPSQTQQMFIPGQEAQGKSLVQRFAGALKGGITGFKTGGLYGGIGGAVAGAFL